MGKQVTDTLDELSRWMLETICRWMPGANVWHFADITLPVRDLIWRPTLGVWFALADISPRHTQGVITAYFCDDHLELKAVYTFSRVPQTSENTDLCFLWLLVDLLLRAGTPAPPDALGASAGSKPRWVGGLTGRMGNQSLTENWARQLVALAYLDAHIIFL